jgi:hypothetical protein
MKMDDKKPIDAGWDDLYLRISIRMAIRCKQRIMNVPIAMYNADGSASVLWNGYRDGEHVRQD